MKFKYFAIITLIIILAAFIVSAVYGLALTPKDKTPYGIMIKRTDIYAI